MVFGRKKPEDDGDKLIAQGLAMMIGCYEDLERRLIKLSKPSAGFDSDLWPPKGVDKYLMMVTDMLPMLRETSEKHREGIIAPQLIGELIKGAQEIGNGAEDFITTTVNHAVAQQALRKASKNA